MDWEDLCTLLSRPISFHRIFATIGGGACCGLFLSQTFYWSQRTTNPDGWFYKTQVEWEEETALTRYEQETVRKQLIKRGLLETKKEGIPCKLYYRLVPGAIIAAIQETKRARTLTESQFGENPQTSLETLKPSETQYVENHQTGMGKTTKLDAVKPPNNLNTETTPEITSETTLSPSSLTQLPKEERERFESFVDKEWRKVKGVGVADFDLFLAQESKFKNWWRQFLASPDGKQAKKEAIESRYDWENFDRTEEWLIGSYERTHEWLHENEAEREMRHAFYKHARANDLYARFIDT